MGWAEGMVNGKYSPMVFFTLKFFERYPEQ